MNKPIKLGCIVVLIAIAYQGASDFSLADRDQPQVESTLIAEPSKHIITSTIGTMCPRTLVEADPITSSAAEHQHCSECRMGVYFKREGGQLECSYCNHLAQDQP